MPKGQEELYGIIRVLRATIEAQRSYHTYIQEHPNDAGRRIAEFAMRHLVDTAFLMSQFVETANKEQD